MKRLFVLLFLMVVLVACNNKEEATVGNTEEAGEETVAIEHEVQEDKEVAPIMLEAFMPSNEVDIYGYVSVLAKVTNPNDVDITVHEKDFILFDNETNSEFDITVEFGNYDAKPEEITIPANGENYVLGYYNISEQRPDIWAINMEEFEMKYVGDTEVESNDVALQIDYEEKYTAVIEEIVNSTVMEEETVAVDESNKATSNQGLVISLYGSLDDEDAHVRVENKSNSSIYFDSRQLKVYDDSYSYGVDPTVFDSAFDPTMTLAPGDIVDYREFFILENPMSNDRDEIAEKLIGAIYAPQDGPTIYGNIYPEENMPEDFGD